MGAAMSLNKQEGEYAAYSKKSRASCSHMQHALAILREEPHRHVCGQWHVAYRLSEPE